MIAKGSSVLVWFVVVANELAAAGTGPVQPRVRGISAPIAFEEQEPGAPAEFVARGRRYALKLAATEVTFIGTRRRQAADGQEPHRLQVNWLGANRQVHWQGCEELPGRASYFRGADPNQWRTGVRQYRRVTAAGLYPGVDVVFYGNEHQLEFDMVLAPGADAGQVRLHFRGLDCLTAENSGSLVLETGGATLRLLPPRVYQPMAGRTRTVSGRYRLEAGSDEVSFELGDYDPGHCLVIDPVLIYSTQVGGSGDDVAQGVALDAVGHVFVVGTTTSLDFPVPHGATAKSTRDKDIFVSKFSADGSQLLYTTFLGGSGDETGLGIAVDAQGNAAVLGSTTSTNFPVVKPVQATNGGGTDVVIAQLDPTGAHLLFATYYGGTGTEPLSVNFLALAGNPIAVDGAGNLYIAGTTTSTNFPTTRALQPRMGGFISPGEACNAFIAKMLPGAPVPTYSTYFCDPNAPTTIYAYGIAADGGGNAYFCGSSLIRPQGSFVGKLAPDGSRLVYLKHLNSGPFSYSDYEAAYAIAVDSAGFACVVGTTTATNFPAVNAAQPIFGGGPRDFPGPSLADAFVVKLDPTGATVFSTYLGGPADPSAQSSYGVPAQAGDAAYGVAIDTSGEILVTGLAGSPRFPRTNPPPNVPGTMGTFLAAYGPTGQQLFCAAFGNSLDSTGFGVAVDQNDNAWLAGFNNAVPGYGLPNVELLKVWYRTNLTVRITSPTNWSNLPVDQPFTVTTEVAQAVAPTARVDWYAGTVLIGSSSSFPFQLVWSNAYPTSYALTAVATDTKGNTGTSRPVTVILTDQGRSYPAYAIASIPDPPQYDLQTDVTSINNLGQATGSVDHNVSGDFGGVALFWDQGVAKTIGAAALSVWMGGNSINDLGEIVGFLTPMPGYYSTAWRIQPEPGALSFTNTPAPPFPAGYTEANRVNNAGQVLCTAYGLDGMHLPVSPVTAYLWQTSQAINLGRLPDAADSQGFGLNNRGQVVGVSGTNAFLWGDGVMTDLNSMLPPQSGWVLSSAADLNDAGQIVGTGFKDGSSAAFLFQDETVIDLSNGGAGDFLPVALNGTGQVVGSNSLGQAVLWQAGRSVNLNYLLPAGSAWVLASAVDINDRGQIVGRGTLGRLTAPFVLTPQPLLQLSPQPGYRPADGTFQVTLTGPPGVTCVLETSGDLRTWTPLATLSCTGAPVDYQDPAARGQAQRFYRAALAR